MSDFYGVMTIPSNPILPNLCIIEARPEGSAVAKRELFSFWTRFTAGLFLVAINLTAAFVPGLPFGGYAFAALGSSFCGFALRRRRFARRASRNRSALIRSLSCASFAKCHLQFNAYARAPDAKSPAKAQVA